MSARSNQKLKQLEGLGTRGDPFSSVPPSTSTVPSLSNVALWAERGVPMLPVVAKVPLDGSKTSADATELFVASVPPVSSTVPLPSSVAACVCNVGRSFRLLSV